MKKSSVLIRSTLFAALLSLTGHFAHQANAEDWVRVSSRDEKVSVLFPTDIQKTLKTQVDKTAAGKVESRFGDYMGDGIIFTASGSELPFLARAAGERIIFNNSKKTFLKQAEGTEVSFTETAIGGAPARALIYTGPNYKGRALFTIVNKRLYVINSQISKPSAANSAAEKKLFDSVEAQK
jgi:hypothetical protein